MLSVSKLVSFLKKSNIWDISKILIHFISFAIEMLFNRRDLRSGKVFCSFPFPWPNSNASNNKYILCYYLLHYLRFQLPRWTWNSEMLSKPKPYEMIASDFHDFFRLSMMGVHAWTLNICLVYNDCTLVARFAQLEESLPSHPLAVIEWLTKGFHLRRGGAGFISIALVITTWSLESHPIT